jgi:hypothetical protein
VVTVLMIVGSGVATGMTTGSAEVATGSEEETAWSAAGLWMASDEVAIGSEDVATGSVL